MLSWSQAHCELVSLTAMSRLRARRRNAVSTRAPENYWIERPDVMGATSTEEILSGRQSDTYLAVANAVKEFGAVLDLGCNVAAVGRVLYSQGWAGRYCGVDSNPKAVDFARRELGSAPGQSDVRVENIRNLPFGDRDFPVVVMKDVLEHMEAYEPFLAEAMRIADRSVVIANFIPWTEGESVIRREKPGYFHNMYSRRQVYATARSNGFEIAGVVGTLEQDARPNEIVVFKRSR
jgi:SAM-dependent methyltransferase